MMHRASAPHRTLLLGLFTVGLLIAAGHGLPAWLAWRRQVTDAAATANLAAAEAAVLARLAPVLADSFAARSGRLVELAPFTIQGQTAAAAAANLGLHVSSVLARAGIRAEAFQIAVDTLAYDHFSILSARIRVDVHTLQLLEVVTVIEHGRPMLRISDFSATRTGEEKLSVELTVQGLTLREPVAGAQ
jgi:hypothetical protein